MHPEGVARCAQPRAASCRHKFPVARVCTPAHAVGADARQKLRSKCDRSASLDRGTERATDNVNSYHIGSCPSVGWPTNQGKKNARCGWRARRRYGKGEAARGYGRARRRMAAKLRLKSQGRRLGTGSGWKRNQSGLPSNAGVNTQTKDPDDRGDVRVSYFAGWGLGVSGARDPHPACRNNVGLCKAFRLRSAAFALATSNTNAIPLCGDRLGALTTSRESRDRPAPCSFAFARAMPAMANDAALELRKHGAPITMWWCRALADGGIARVEQVL